MLITEQGSAGRYGSIVIDKYLSLSEKFTESPCLYYRDGSCDICISECPTDALTEEGFNRGICYERCLENKQKFRNDFNDEAGAYDVCGKCQSGSCSFGIPK
jgi:epoxyqueuosine reductase QueG